MPAEDRQRHWGEAAERIALVGCVAVLSVGAIYWLFVHWSLENRPYPGLNFGDTKALIKTVGRLTLSSLATIVLLGAEVLLFRWWFRR